jgi:hypothetical protein
MIRLLALVDPALEVLANEMKNKKDGGMTRLRAAENVLNRAGLSPEQVVKLSFSASELLARRISVG